MKNGLLLFTFCVVGFMTFPSNDAKTVKKNTILVQKCIYKHKMVHYRTNKMVPSMRKLEIINALCKR